MLFRAATVRAQLTVTTSSTKRRKVAEPSSPGAVPGSSFASSAPTRRHGNRSGDSLPLPPDPGRPASASDSSRSRSSSGSPSSYVPAHLQVGALGFIRPRSHRSHTPDCAHSGPEDSATACAGLSLSSDTVADMPGLEKRDGSASPPSAPGTRSSSPGTKRSADEITGSGPDAEVESGSAGDNLPSDPVSTDSAHTTDKTGAHTGSDPIYSTPPSMATDTAPSATNDGSKADAVTDSDAVPSIDDQVAKVNCAAAQPLEENQKGYVVSMSWMKKVFARSTNYTDKADESATKGDIGPLDNSDIVLDIDESAVVQDEAGEEFVPLRPDARMGVDFEIVPQEGWDMIMKWYGLADESPVIARYAHKTTSTGDVENIQYELNPPIFTIFKISNPAEGTTPQTLKDKRTPPPRIMATRASNFQQWLRRVKEVTNVDMQHKVRIWTIQTSGIESTSAAGPATSRNVSPKHAPPNAVNLGHCLIVDLNTFLSLPEGQRVLMESLKDQTNNPNYNGKMALDLAGLGEDEKIVVLEESLGGKGAQWVSDASKKDLERHGLTAGSAKVAPLPKSKAKIPVSSNRSLQPKQPARGRRGSWRPLGCTGIRNLGNTCYMAAALQCMQHVEELSHYFLSKYALTPHALCEILTTICSRNARIGA